MRHSSSNHVASFLFFGVGIVGDYEYACSRALNRIQEHGCHHVDGWRCTLAFYGPRALVFIGKGEPGDSAFSIFILCIQSPHSSKYSCLSRPDLHRDDSRDDIIPWRSPP
jgi:hypothetical protein